MKLVSAEGGALDQILDESHDIWSDGLTRAAYARFNAAQTRTPWGSRHLRRCALLDGHGRVLSSAKRYDLRARLDGREIAVVGLGAVFTPDRMRGRGHARMLVERIIAAAVTEGAELALLFSEIDPAYYMAMEFVPIPRRELLIRVKEKPGAPMVLVRAGEERDIPAVAALANAMASHHRFALVPTEDAIRFSLSKKRLLAGFLPPGALSVEFYIVEEGAGPVAFAILTVTSEDVILEMCGDRDPSGARVGALLQVLRARTPAAAAPKLACFLPHHWLPTQVEVEASAVVREVMMVRPLRDGLLAAPLKEQDVLFWHGDLF
ncbi:MAG TPA: GNAT family N-acetyltransferase [Vicinamibacterales bacterium]|nr:GNAT family N-acetyltransferase [Vicinamibacterales bacterium]